MNKLISLILVICMGFTLCSFEAMAATDADCSCGPDCDCRLRALTPEEEEEIFYKVAAQKGISVPQGLGPNDIVVESLEMRLTYNNGEPASIDDYDKFYLTARVSNLSNTPVESLNIKTRLLDWQGNELDAGNWDELMADLILPGDTGIVERMNDVTRAEDIAAVQLLYFRCAPDFSERILFTEPYSYSIEEIFGAAAEESTEESSAETVELGESIVTASAELKVTGISITDQLLKTPLNEPKYYIMPGGDGNQVYAQIHFELTNLSKENHAIGELVSFGIDYNDGYVYDMENSAHSCEICDNSLPGLYASYHGSGNYNGDIKLTAVPLVQTSYTLCIPCPRIVAEDETGLLKINISVENEGQRERYVCTVRDENSSQLVLDYSDGSTVYVSSLY